MCPTSDGIEDTEHLSLLCPSFDLQRRDLLAGIVELLRPFVQIASLSNDALTQLLLYGDQDLSNDLNKNILELTIRFIHKTGRFDQYPLKPQQCVKSQPPSPFMYDVSSISLFSSF